MKRRTFITGMGAAPIMAAVSSCAKRQTVATIPHGDIPRMTLGKTGMKVSRLGFGSHVKENMVKNQELRNSMIRTSHDRGVNFFDVYDHMDCFQFEPMGNTIKDFRKDVFVSLVIIKPPDQMQAEIDSALRAFKTDYIDLYRLYAVNDDSMNIMEKNKKAGKIRAIGVVDHLAGKLNGYIDTYGDTIDYLMIIYNFHHNKAILFKDQIDPSFENDYSELFPKIERYNYGVVGMKPMGSDAMIDLAKEERFFNNRDASVAKAMLRYVYQRPEIHTTIPAMNSVGELSTNLESIYRPSLSAEERRLLDRLSAKASSLKGAWLPPKYKFLEDWAAHTA